MAARERRQGVRHRSRTRAHRVRAGRIVDGWGFNGSMPGPTIQVIEGDRVRLIVKNRLPGAVLDALARARDPDRDGRHAGHLAGCRFRRADASPTSSRCKQNGTFFYHSHMAMQEMMGLIGLFIIHPRTRARAARRSRLRHRPAGMGDPAEQHDPELAGDGVQLADDERQGRPRDDADAREAGRARADPARESGDGSPSDAHARSSVLRHRAPRAAASRRQRSIPENTVLVGVAQARDIEFVANNPGDWHFHCHLPHHMMNQMASMVGPLMMSHANAAAAGIDGRRHGRSHEGHALSEAAARRSAAPSTSAPRRPRNVANMPLGPAPATALPPGRTRRATECRHVPRLSAGHVSW